ncbi:glycosyltransferase family 2 protein [Salinispora fenicalii]|uniref:glycosyltransferase family 2 protein n=1 Tax=Salinispora fenicalii TaxID=1137263 RepID=UPI00048288F2|nr:glycosyltransferase [Salinispora fenicalii]
MVTNPQPLLSVVVPVYGVEEQLHQCLDSLFDGLNEANAADMEVVAVNDASPDRCGELLQAYAAQRPAVRTLTLSRNVGLGLARNAGLDVVTGQHVWFVDSDDWLPTGSVTAVLGRLRADRPDVLLFDHLRVHHNGRGEMDASSHLLRGVDGCVRLDERPELLRVQHTAWNKVVSRTFLTGLGIRFYPGWYEDIPFSHPLLIAAERIAVLDRICYHYRQGRPGAITATSSERHFDAFEQYDRLFDWLLSARPQETRLHADLFERMISHLLVVVGNNHRMPAKLRRSFFHRVSAYYRRYRPTDGYPRPGGIGGLKHRLIASNSYLAYKALRNAHRLVTRRPPARERVPVTGPIAESAERQPHLMAAQR